MKNYRSLQECLGLRIPKKAYFDMLSANGLPSMSSISSNIQAPTLSDIGGSVGQQDTALAQGPTNAFNSYMNYANSMPTASSTYQSLLNQNGIPQLQKTSENLQGNINNLENTMYRVTPNVSANTGNSLVTDSQRQGMVAAQELPIQNQLQPLESNLSTVQNSLGTQEQNIASEVGAQNTNQSNLLGAAGMGVTTAQQNAAMEASGFSQDQSSQLQSLLQKLSIEGTLDAAEWSTLSTLSENQQTYQQALGTISAQENATLANTYAGQRFATVPAGSTLVNTATGGTFAPK